MFPISVIEALPDRNDTEAILLAVSNMGVNLPHALRARLAETMVANK